MLGKVVELGALGGMGLPEILVLVIVVGIPAAIIFLVKRATRGTTDPMGGKGARHSGNVVCDKCGCSTARVRYCSKCGSPLA